MSVTLLGSEMGSGIGGGNMGLVLGFGHLSGAQKRHHPGGLKTVLEPSLA